VDFINGSETFNLTDPVVGLRARNI